MVFVLEETWSAFGNNSEVPDGSWHVLSRHRSRNGAVRKLRQVRQEMHERCGYQSWDRQFRVIGPAGRIEHIMPGEM